MHQALKSKTESIGLLSKNDETKVIRCISNLFKAISMYFDNVLTQNKAELIAAELLAKYEYRSLRLEDLVVVCIRIKESDTFKMTPARILREVSKYSKEREKLAIELSLQVSESNKSVNYQLEDRLQKHLKLTPNADRLATKRNEIATKFK